MSKLFIKAGDYYCRVFLARELGTSVMYSDKTAIYRAVWSSTQSKYTEVNTTTLGGYEILSEYSSADGIPLTFGLNSIGPVKGISYNLRMDADTGTMTGPPVPYYATTAQGVGNNTLYRLYNRSEYKNWLYRAYKAGWVSDSLLSDWLAALNSDYTGADFSTGSSRAVSIAFITNTYATIDNISYIYPITFFPELGLITGTNNNPPYSGRISVSSSDLIIADSNPSPFGVDPYTPALPSESTVTPSESAGGDGTFDFDSDLIPDSSTPTNPFAGGMITGYMLTDAQMQQLAQFLWASPWDWLAQWRKLWGDPMNAIIGCFKVNLPAYSGSSATVKIGNIDTGISALAVSGIATVNCGTVFIDKKYGSYLDYSPYTSLELYLPYIGTVGLNVDEVMGKYITVSYNVCLLDGSATCTVFVGDGTNLSVLHQYSCMVGMNVPITSAQYDGMQRSLSNVIGAVTDNIVPAITTIAGVAAGLLNPAIAAGALGGMASNIMGSEENNPVTLNKPNIRHSGGISMASGLMGRQRPYIIRHTPRMAFPEGQNTYIGYPNWTGMSLGSLSGFTRVHKIHLSCSGTEEEKAEIVRLLMEGVIL